MSNYFLSKPSAGWTNVNIPELDNSDVVLPASYITDVPNDCLDTMINALENNMDFSVSFDAEGWDFKVVSDMEDTYVIVSRDNYKIYHSDINKFKLGELLYQNIFNYSDAWAIWNPNTDIGDMQLEENELMRKLNKLKLLLDDKTPEEI